MARHTRQSGFTLIELLIVIALISLVAGVLIPYANPSLRDQLNSAAELLSNDINFARSLAVANSSNYRITFDAAQNRYVLQHVGTNPALNTLPKSPYSLPGDPTDQQIVRFAKLPGMGQAVRMYGARTVATSPVMVTNVEFGPLGETTRSEETQIWLAAGTGAATRYISVRINPVTGLTWIENYQTIDPFASGGPTAS